jgi:hypothetical protein
MKGKSKLSGVVAAVLSLAFLDVARSDTLFFDDFNSGASSAWGNESGNWTAAGGVYRAQVPDNVPNSRSLLTTFPSLTDFSVTVDVISGRDGGVWLRATNDGSQLGVTGVLLIFLNDAGHPNTLFWHDVSNSAYGDELNKVENLPLGNFTLRIDVKDNMYSAYVNGIRQPQLT